MFSRLSELYQVDSVVPSWQCCTKLAVLYLVGSVVTG